MEVNGSGGGNAAKGNARWRANEPCSLPPAFAQPSVRGPPATRCGIVQTPDSTGFIFRQMRTASAAIDQGPEAPAIAFGGDQAGDAAWIEGTLDRHTLREARRALVERWGQRRVPRSIDVSRLSTLDTAGALLRTGATGTNVADLAIWAR